MCGAGNCSITESLSERIHRTHRTRLLGLSASLLAGGPIIKSSFPFLNWRPSDHSRTRGNRPGARNSLSLHPLAGAVQCQRELPLSLPSKGSQTFRIRSQSLHSRNHIVFAKPKRSRLFKTEFTKICRQAWAELCKAQHLLGSVLLDRN